jgi:hypothetical protein
MKTKKETALTGIWAVTWRSFVYMPLGFLVFFLLLCAVIAVLFPPILGIGCLFLGFWWQGIALFAFWFLVLWAWRYFRVGCFFESPPSVL